MRKIGIVWIVVILLTAMALSSCASTREVTYEPEFILTTPNDLHDIMLNKIDLSIQDLRLTKDELEAVRKYSKYSNILRAATYEWSGKSEYITYDDSIFHLGADVFELEAISKILGINIEIEQMAIADALDGLDSGQIDMVPGIYLNDDMETHGLSLEHGTVTDYIYAYSIDKKEIDDITDLDGLNIGVVRNLNIMNNEIISALINANIEYVLYGHQLSEEDAMESLRNGDIDILFHTFSSDLIFNELYSTNVSQIFQEYASTIMFTDKNEDIQHLMSAINKIYEYDDGDYMQLVKYDYMDMFNAMVVSTGVVFSFPERVFLYDASDEPINILAVEGSAPYIYYEGLTGEWSGVSYYIWDAVAELAGFEYNIIESDDNSTEVFSKITTGELTSNVSAIIPMHNTHEKQEYLIFSEPVLVDKFVVVGLHETATLTNIHSLANTKVGVVEGFAATSTLRTYLPLEEYYNDYTSNDELVFDLVEGVIDYVVLTESEFNEYFYDLRYYDLSVKLELSETESCIAFFNNPSGRALRSIYNKVMPFVRPNEIIEAYTSVNTDINEVMQTRSRDMIIMFAFMFVVIILFLGFFIRRLSRANKQVREIAFVNSITGLQNRTAFYNENTLATGSLIYVDLDDFKRMNDVHGHDIGDMYAFEIAQRIQAIAEEFDMQAYTMDIDSFLLLDDGTYTEDKLISISAKILYEITKNVRIYDIDHKLTASIGIAVKEDERGMEELFKKVDTALFLAKERGKNRYVVASEDEFVAHRKKQFLNEQLTQETIQKDIDPFYQPKIDIRDGRIIGVEALARWQSKEQGMILPDEILPIISDNGMLPILDVSILTKACRDYVGWMDKKLIERNFIVSCNMSYQTIEAFDIVAAVKQIHDNIGMPYRSLELEIDEQDFINHMDDINDKLIELAKLGVNIAIDHFKAERSIMTQIAKLPVNVVKVDKGMLKDGITKKTREMFDLISNLTMKLNLGLIIVGVETPEQIQLLKEIPIYRVQGFYYSEAIPKTRLENELRVKYVYR